MANKWQVKQLRDYIINNFPSDGYSDLVPVEANTACRLYVYMIGSENGGATNEEFIKVTEACWNTLIPEMSYGETLKADFFNDSIGLEEGDLGKVLDPNPGSLWEKLPQHSKAIILMKVLVIKFGFVVGYRDTGKILKDSYQIGFRSLGENYKRKIGGIAPEDFFADNWFDYDAFDGNLRSIGIRKEINNLFPKGNQLDIRITGPGTAGTGSFKFPLGIFEKLNSNNGKIFLKDVLGLEAENANFILENPEILAEVLTKSKNEAAQNAATLSFSEFTGRLGDEASDELNAFLKRAEQCFLMGSLSVFSEFSYNSRNSAPKPTLDKRPYGARVYPVKVVDTGNNASFINLMQTDANIFDFVKNYTLNVSKCISYNALFYKVEQTDGDGPFSTSVEKPLLFGLSKDPNGDVENNPNYQGLHESLKGASADAYKILNNTKTSKAKEGINIKSVNLKFTGETTATARSNVDVSVEIELTDISLLQAEFSAYTNYTDISGVKQKKFYKYSLLDFLTYSFNVNTSATTRLLQQGQARIFTPKFYRNHNRMLLKVSHQLVADEKNSNKKKIDNLGLSEKVLSHIKDHLKSSDMVLDLNLVDHTIKKDQTTQKATISIEYKGFVKNFFNDPITDISRPSMQHYAIKEKEKKLIESLAETKSVQKARKQISSYNKDLENLNKTHLETGSNEIIKNLRKRKKLFRVPYDSASVFGNNVTTDGYEIYSPKQINNFFNRQYHAGKFHIITKSGVKRIQPVATPVDAYIPAVSKINENLEGDKAGAEVLTENNAQINLDFFFFGDLCDVLLDNFYQYNDPYNEVEKSNSYHTNFRKPESLRGLDTLPLKIVLPPWKPLVAIGGADLNNPSSEATGDESDFKQSEKEYSLADFPISLNTFVKWWDKNVKEKSVAFLSIGSFISRFVNDVINSSLIETCYLNGYGNLTRYAVKMDYGQYGRDKEQNKENESKNLIWWDLFRKDGEYNLYKFVSPFLRKSPRIERKKMCNFLIVYPQTIPFSEYGDLKNSDSNHRDNNIPYFRLYDSPTENYTAADKMTGDALKFFPKGIMNRSVQFNKVENSKYLREYRYDVEGLSSLSQLSSVYNCTVTTFPLLSMFPGMLFYADAGLYFPAEKYGSVAHILGLGGYHITISVSHAFKLNEFGKIINPRTTIEGVWTFTGENSGEPVINTESPSDSEEDPEEPTEYELEATAGGDEEDSPEGGVATDESTEIISEPPSPPERETNPSGTSEAKDPLKEIIPSANPGGYTFDAE